MRSIWSDERPPPWHQLKQFLRDDDDVRSLLAERLLTVYAGQLSDLGPLSLRRRSDATWFTGTWEGNQVVLKLNVTERERFWMTAISQRAPDAVARVHASGDDLDGLGVRFLVLERLGPHAPEPPTPEWFSAALDASLAFQTAARTVDASLVDDEGLAFWERWVGAHADAAPGPVRALVAHLPEDLEWVDAHIERHVLFGDLHFGNMAATGESSLRVRLFDPIPRCQPWVFEPIYFEQSCAGDGLVAAMAARRRAAGMLTPDDSVVSRTETLLQAWIGVMWWGIVGSIREDAGACERLAGWVTNAVKLDR